MPPPPPPRFAPQPSGYPSPTTPVLPQPGPYGYDDAQMPGAAPPPTRRPPGVDATANAFGAIGGVVVTALAVGVMLHASTELANRYNLLGEARASDILLLLVSVAMFGAVVVGGRVAPAGPMVSGAALAVVGLAGLLSTEFGSWLFRNYPVDRDARGLIGWIALGAFVVIGGVIFASGLASALGRRR
jgi:hypothetical protein